jgi:hypothetical protein
MEDFWLLVHNLPMWELRARLVLRTFFPRAQMENGRRSFLHLNFDFPLDQCDLIVWRAIKWVQAASPLVSLDAGDGDAFGEEMGS